MGAGKSRVWPAGALALSTLALVAACGGGGGGGDNTTTTTTGGTLVYSGRFAGFHSWVATPGVGPVGAPQDLLADADGGVHSLGPMTSYIDPEPPPGSTSFPLGTAIVKEVNVGDLTTRKIFAMYKRGGGFNSTGALDWEYFELQNLDADNVQILWRGNGPPSSTETYGGNPATCNDCHVQAKSNDFIWTAGFQLSSF